VKWADVSKPLPYEAACFDNAFTHDVLEHLTAEAMDALFADVRRLLKPGGLFLNVVPNQKGFNAGLDPAVGHIRFVDLSAVHQAASKNGF
jgi:SAM-dependent methyltransferase